jgi:hypothetical protein
MLLQQGIDILKYMEQVVIDLYNNYTLKTLDNVCYGNVSMSFIETILKPQNLSRLIEILNDYDQGTDSYIRCLINEQIYINIMDSDDSKQLIQPHFLLVRDSKSGYFRLEMTMYEDSKIADEHKIVNDTIYNYLQQLLCGQNHNGNKYAIGLFKTRTFLKHLQDAGRVNIVKFLEKGHMIQIGTTGINIFYQLFSIFRANILNSIGVENVKIMQTVIKSNSFVRLFLIIFRNILTYFSRNKLTNKELIELKRISNGSLIADLKKFAINYLVYHKEAFCNLQIFERTTKPLIISITNNLFLNHRILGSLFNKLKNLALNVVVQELEVFKRVDFDVNDIIDILISENSEKVEIFKKMISSFQFWKNPIKKILQLLLGSTYKEVTNKLSLLDSENYNINFTGLMEEYGLKAGAISSLAFTRVIIGLMDAESKYRLKKIMDDEDDSEIAELSEIDIPDTKAECKELCNLDGYAKDSSPIIDTIQTNMTTISEDELPYYSTTDETNIRQIIVDLIYSNNLKLNNVIAKFVYYVRATGINFIKVHIPDTTSTQTIRIPLVISFNGIIDKDRFLYYMQKNNIKMTISTTADDIIRLDQETMISSNLALQLGDKIPKAFTDLQLQKLLSITSLFPTDIELGEITRGSITDTLDEKYINIGIVILSLVKLTESRTEPGYLAMIRTKYLPMWIRALVNEKDYSNMLSSIREYYNNLSEIYEKLSAMVGGNRKRTHKNRKYNKSTHKNRNENRNQNGTLPLLKNQLGGSKFDESLQVYFEHISTLNESLEKGGSENSEIVKTETDNLQVPLSDEQLMLFNNYLAKIRTKTFATKYIGDHLIEKRGSDPESFNPFLSYYAYLLSKLGKKIANLNDLELNLALHTNSLYLKTMNQPSRSDTQKMYNLSRLILKVTYKIFTTYLSTRQPDSGTMIPKPVYVELKEMFSSTTAVI